jgi:hypothetical protein
MFFILYGFYGGYLYILARRSPSFRPAAGAPAWIASAQGLPLLMFLMERCSSFLTSWVSGEAREGTAGGYARW